MHAFQHEPAIARDNFTITVMKPQPTTAKYGLIADTTPQLRWRRHDHRIR